MLVNKGIELLLLGLDKVIFMSPRTLQEYKEEITGIPQLIMTMELI